MTYLVRFGATMFCVVMLSKSKDGYESFGWCVRAKPLSVIRSVILAEALQIVVIVS